VYEECWFTKKNILNMQKLECNFDVQHVRYLGLSVGPLTRLLPFTNTMWHFRE